MLITYHLSFPTFRILRLQDLVASINITPVRFEFGVHVGYVSVKGLDHGEVMWDM